MIYYGTMEEGFYEVDVKSLAVTELYKDGNNARGNRVEHNDTDVNPQNAMLAGAHGKGLYSGQGGMVYSNNGEASQEALQKFDVEAGALAEWNGVEWKIARRNQFVEVTGPGGIMEMPTLKPTPSGLPAGITNRCCWGFVMQKPAGIFIACPKPVTVTTAPMAGIPNGRVSAISEHLKILIT
jgi:hypothetical protein